MVEGFVVEDSGGVSACSVVVVGTVGLVVVVAALVVEDVGVSGNS